MILQNDWRKRKGDTTHAARCGYGAPRIASAPLIPYYPDILICCRTGATIEEGLHAH